MKQSSFRVLSVLATALLYLLWWNTSLLSQLDYQLLDRCSRFFPSHNSPDHTVVVEIDDKSLKAFGQWPWPRMVTAELIHRLAAAQPDSVALDVVFSEQDRSSPKILERFYRDFFDLNVSISGIPDELRDNDRLLVQSFTETKVILPVFSDASQEAKECLFPSHHPIISQINPDTLYSIDALVCSLPLYQKYAYAVGHIHAGADSDGVLRRINMFVRYRDEVIPTLGSAALADHDTGYEASAISQLMSFYPYESYDKVSAYDILSGRVDPEILKGKHIFVGTTALGLDTWHTLSNGTVLPGVYVHATVAENILNHDLKIQPEGYKSFHIILSFLFALLLLNWMAKTKRLRILFSSLAVLILALVATMIGLKNGVYISMGYFIVPLLSFLFILSLLMFIIDYRNTKRFLEDMRRSSEQKEMLKSELDRSESEIEYQKAMLYQQSKLAAMGEMIDNIAHQWRQPLNNLAMIVQDAEFAYPRGRIDQTNVAKMTSDSMDQINFMSQTIDDFRNFVKPDQHNNPFDVNEAVAESLQLLEGMCRAHFIHVDVVYCSQPLIGFGSSSEFKQVMINLLNNARDALVEHKVSDPLITIRLFCDGTHGAITIQDNGGGIDERVIERIFEPYFTTKEEGKGSGIGLYISYSIIRTKMGGTIEASNVEGGTRFTITIPLYKDPFDDEV